jgi:HprK-related kinase A
MPLNQLVAAVQAGRFALDYGACTVRVRGGGPGFAQALQTVYGAFGFVADPEFADLHVSMEPGRGLRRWLRPQVQFMIDGLRPFEPFPASSTLPLYEWGVNWCFAQRFSQYVLLHAGVLADGERAVVMPAVPGSGKSTLTAALMLGGLRLLSDEFGVLCPESGELLPMLKPVGLKNASIDVIRAFSAQACLGPVSPGTRKGDVAHLAPDAASVTARRLPARPALVIFPRYVAGAPLELRTQTPDLSFTRLAFNSFNYATLGRVSFDAVTALAAACPAYQLTYSRLDEAVACVRELLGRTSHA